ncbi:hypothetical protein EU245_03060 [Lentibacillus lipolyticus]|nr:hypothetical protein EU245_03060 [Lentibacillus lipolyticus]
MHFPPYGDQRLFQFPWFQDNGPGMGPPFNGPSGQTSGGSLGFQDGPQQVSAPNSPPPPFTPQQPQSLQAQGDVGVFAVDPGAIRGCLFQFTYIWLRWDAFWFFPIYVGRHSIAGFRWQRNRWVYYGVDLDNVQSFQCY